MPADDPVRHVVEEGECVGSIAFERGMWWQTVWLDPLNDALREKRSNPNVLSAGDVLMVPAKRLKRAAAATGQLHRFRRKGVPARLRFKIVEGGVARANEPYSIIIDGKSISGTTGAAGEIDLTLAPNATSGTLTVGAGADARQFTVTLRTLAPVTEPGGAQRRLQNLGYDVFGETGDIGPGTAAALRRFQQDQSLEVTGALDEATASALVSAHGV